MNIESIEKSVNKGAEAAKLNALRNNEGTQAVGSLRHVLSSKLGFGQGEIEDLAEKDSDARGVHAFVYGNESETIH